MRYEASAPAHCTGRTPANPGGALRNPGGGVRKGPSMPLEQCLTLRCRPSRSSAIFGSRWPRSRWTALPWIALGLSLSLPSAAQQGTGGSGTGGSSSGAGGSGTGGSGTGGSGTGGSGTGGSSMAGASGSGGAEAVPADCIPAPPDECTDRCPTFYTCPTETDAGDPALYYSVDGQRFDCDGLKCESAASQLQDYCCQRGKFAPSGDDGGGCALAPHRGAAPAGTTASGSPPSGTANVGALLGVALGLLRRRRSRRPQ